MTILVTARLRLEPLADLHLDGFNAMNADPEVMRSLTGKPETLEESRTIIERVKGRWADVGYSWRALVERDSGEVVGAGALQNLRREATLLPDPDCPLEIGWRLRRGHWGRGYAIVDFAFDRLQPDELLAVCHPDNAASSGVMKRLGMTDQGLQRWYGKEVATHQLAAAAWRANAAQRSAKTGG